MRAIDRRSAEAWAQAHGYELDSRMLPALRDSDEIERFSIPQDAGKRVSIVRGHLRMFESEEEVCVWIYDWNVWPSGQWHHLFDRFRHSYGITHSLDERPCHLIPRKEFDATISTVVYSVLMLWDCHVLAPSGRPFAFYSHDEFGRKRG
jgi:hypothetical protein